MRPGEEYYRLRCAGWLWQDIADLARVNQHGTVVRCAGDYARKHGLQWPITTPVLTHSQVETCLLFSRGLSRRQVAGELGITIASLADRCHHLNLKMGTRRTSEAVLKALSMGLVR